MMSSSAVHDTGYKLLFDHPELVRDLLLGFVPGPWEQAADFSTLERVNASYVSESERQRHDDMVWRLKVGPRWVWIYLLLEFQSEPDAWMALRMMAYLSLLAQHLVREGQLDEHGKLPGIVPIVLYNGQATWKVATNVSDCFAPSLPGLEPFRPRLLYHLVDEARLKLHPLAEMRNLAEAIFQLENSRTAGDIQRVLQALGQLLQGPDSQPLRRTIALWMRTLLRRKVPQATITDQHTIDHALQEDAMLQQTLERLYDEATEKGIRQGLEKGRMEGRMEGRHSGLASAVALQAQLRFGDLPAWVDERLERASEDQLTRWLQDILTASSLAELFGNS